MGRSAEPIVAPGELPPLLIDQTRYWVDPYGHTEDVKGMGEAEALFALDVLLANSAHLRDAWATALRQTYDTDQRARQWMLKRKLTRTLMRRLLEIERGSPNSF